MMTLRPAGNWAMTQKAVDFTTQLLEEDIHSARGSTRLAIWKNIGTRCFCEKLHMHINSWTGSDYSYRQNLEIVPLLLSDAHTQRINTPDFQTSLHKHLAVFVIRNLILKRALWHHYRRVWHYCAASYQSVCSQAQPRWRPLLFPCWCEVTISKIRHAYFGKKLSYSSSLNADELSLWRTSVRSCSLFKNATLLFWCCPNKHFDKIKVLIYVAEDQMNNRGWL